MRDFVVKLLALKKSLDIVWNATRLETWCKVGYELWDDEGYEVWFGVSDSTAEIMGNSESYTTRSAGDVTRDTAYFTRKRAEKEEESPREIINLVCYE
jgi:hypothetical protein